MKQYTVAILGATGAVGTQMIQCLAEQDFPVGELRLLASARSAGKQVETPFGTVTIAEAGPDAFAGCDIVLGAVDMDDLPAGWTAYADIDTALAALSQAGIQSLLVEGGERTLQSFIDRGLWDEAWEECAPIVLGEGVPMPKMPVGVPCENETHWGVAYRHWRNSE